jgi:hypothetical protein
MILSGAPRPQRKGSRPMLFELIARIAIAAFVVLFSTNSFAPAAYAAEGAPDRLRNIRFEYRTDIPVADSQAHKLEVWIPLPREDEWQRIEALSIDTQARHEIVTQDMHGNRLLHIVASAPLPATLSATIRFQVTRREQAADVTRAMRDLAEPSDGSFAPCLRSDRLVPTTGRIAEVSAQPPGEGRVALPAGTCDLRIRDIGHEVRQNGQRMGPWRRGLRM